MAYPSDMLESIKRLEATRERRLKQEIPRLTIDQRQDLLKGFHPDHRPDAMVELKVGKNKGTRVAKELLQILEAYSLIDPENFSLGKADCETDVLVVGAGGAGASAALLAKEQGADVILATKLRLGDSNTVMAEGGISAATRSNDNPEKHYLDTLGGGHFYNDPEIVNALVTDAPRVLDWLTDLGVMFDREEDGTYKASFAGGHSRKRVISCKDLSGLEMMRVLRDEVLNRDIRIIEFSPVVELLLDDNGQCSGAVMINIETGQYVIVKAKAVILTTGGMGRLHPQNFPTTNHFGATADGLVLAYRAGAELVDIDSVQYHPTGIAWPEQKMGQLISEALRGRGAHLVNADGERFINELEARDTTSSAILRECTERGKGVRTPTGQDGVWLDTTIVPDVRSEFLGIYQRLMKYGYDIGREPVLVFPTQHYQNGGIKINTQGETSVPGLYAAGEVAGGTQGKNRLGGNSLVDIFVFGRRAGMAAGEYVKTAKIGVPVLSCLISYHKALEELEISRDRMSPAILPDYTNEQ